MSELLSGTRVVVTGATSGLGLAMAAALVDAGATVAVGSRDARRAAMTAERLGGEAVGFELDVRSEQSVDAAVASLWAQLDGVDVLINNAGIGMRTVRPHYGDWSRPFHEVSGDGFRDVFDTKVTGSFLMARAIVPRMLQAGSGRVLTVSMNHATMTRRGFVPYGPAGAAVEALARVMAADLAATPVRANLVLPGGATATGMIPEDFPDAERGHLLDPAIMGPPVVWLCSAAAHDVHDERIVATDFDAWLGQRPSGAGRA